MGERLRVSPEGHLKIPDKMREKLGWKTGAYLECVIQDGVLTLSEVDVDLFEEALKKPDEGSFDEIMKRQAEEKEKAFDLFDKKIQEPPEEVRPEDKPGFWD